MNVASVSAFTDATGSIGGVGEAIGTVVVGGGGGGGGGYGGDRRGGGGGRQNRSN